MSDEIKRRELLFSAAALASTAGVLASRQAQAAVGKGAEKIDQRSDGSYSTLELAKPAWNLGVVQSRVRAVQMDNYKREIADNLAHMLALIDKSFYYGSQPDVLFFHEFPITGWQRWSRDEILKFAIEVPGEETEKISAKARQYNCWIVFGSYVRDKDWPNHVLSITTIIDNKGQVAAKHWKARNIKGVFPGFELFTTTIYDALDRYVEMYGVDEVIPVTRTPLGNLCTSSIQREPELFRAMAFKGAEVILRTASGGFTPLDIQATSLYNSVYTAIVNNAVSPENKNFFDDAGSGGSAVYGPDGKALAEAAGKEEQLVVANIPIGAFRARKRQPIVHMELYREVFAGYQNRYGPNLFTAYQPTSLEDAARYLRDKARWK